MVIVCHFDLRFHQPAIPLLSPHAQAKCSYMHCFSLPPAKKHLHACTKWMSCWMTSIISKRGFCCYTGLLIGCNWLALAWQCYFSSPLLCPWWSLSSSLPGTWERQSKEKSKGASRTSIFIIRHFSNARIMHLWNREIMENKWPFIQVSVPIPFSCQKQDHK